MPRETFKFGNVNKDGEKVTLGSGKNAVQVDSNLLPGRTIDAQRRGIRCRDYLPLPLPSPEASKIALPIKNLGKSPWMTWV